MNSSKLKRTQANPCEPKRTQVNPSEPKRTQANPSKPKRTQANPSKPKQTQANPSEPKRIQANSIEFGRFLEFFSIFVIDALPNDSYFVPVCQMALILFQSAIYHIFIGISHAFWSFFKKEFLNIFSRTSGSLASIGTHSEIY